MAKRSENCKSTHRINLPMTIAMVLFYFTLVSIYLTSGLYAKYTTKGSAQDGARVIKFGGLVLEETCGYMNGTKFVEGDLVIIPGVNLVKDVEVSFTGSEADTYIFVKAEMEGWVTSDYVHFSVMSEELKNDKGEIVREPIELMSMALNTAEWTYLTNEGNTYVYYKLVKNNSEISKIDFVANAKGITSDIKGQIKVSSFMTKKDVEKLWKKAEAGNEIAMNVSAYAAQANGFANVEEAWISISNR